MPIILLTQKQVTVVDESDFYWLQHFKWCADRQRSGRFYARSSYTDLRGRRRYVHMHRFIMNAPEFVQVDHRDGNGLNNSRSNLRLATPLQNSQSKTLSPNQKRGGLKGVSWDESSGLWLAQIHMPNPLGGKGSNKHLGRFTDAVEAARAYDRAARKFFGEFAFTNFPDD